MGWICGAGAAIWFAVLALVISICRAAGVADNETRRAFWRERWGDE